MRISDWSSDVCSSDLLTLVGAGLADDLIVLRRGLDERVALLVRDQRRGDADRAAGVEDVDNRPLIGGRDLDRGMDAAGGGSPDEGDRRSAVSGRRVAVSVELGGRRVLKTKTKD